MRVLVCLTKLQGDERGRAIGARLVQQLTQTTPHLLPRKGPVKPPEEAALSEELRKANAWEVQYRETLAEAESLRDAGRDQLKVKAVHNSRQASRALRLAKELKQNAVEFKRNATQLAHPCFRRCSTCFPCCCCDCCLDCPCWETPLDAEADQPIPPAVEAGPASPGPELEPRL